MLEIDRHERQHGEQARRKRKLGNVGAEIGRPAEEGKIHHGAGLKSLHHDEEQEEDDGPDALDQNMRTGPAVMIARDQPERRQEQKSAERQYARNIKTNRSGVPGF